MKQPLLVAAILLLVGFGVAVFYFSLFSPKEFCKPELICVSSPRSNQIISSPLVLEGQARGTWFFEASFPIRLFDANGKELGVAVAQAQGEWMTQEFVPFLATMEFETPTTATGALVFEKDNPSGLPEHADSLVMPVRFSNQ